MKFLLIILHTVLSILSFALRAILVRYIKEKAIDQQWIRAHIKIDLCNISGGIIVAKSLIIILQELIGPFQLTEIVTSIVLVDQCSLNVLQLSILSLQLMQILNIFCSASVSEWSVHYVFKVHRVVVFLFGALGGCLACALGSGFCAPSPFFLYLLKEDSDPNAKLEHTYVNVASSLVFMTIIFICQAIVEIKRLFADRAEKSANETAVNAAKQLEEASALQATTRSQQVSLQHLQIRSAWEENSARQVDSSETPVIVQTLEKPNRKQAIQAARIIFLMGIVGTSVLVFATRFECLNQYRPHITVFSLCFFYGVIVPLVIIISNPRIRHFSFELIRKNLTNQFQ